MMTNGMDIMTENHFSYHMASSLNTPMCCREEGIKSRDMIMSKHIDLDEPEILFDYFLISLRID